MSWKQNLIRTSLLFFYCAITLGASCALAYFASKDVSTFGLWKGAVSVGLLLLSIGLAIATIVSGSVDND